MNLKKVAVNGIEIWMDMDDKILPRYYEKNGSVDPYEMQLLDSSLEPGMTFLEIGAYVGDHTVHMAKKVGSIGKGYAIEAAPQNYLLLEKNLSEYNLKHVNAIHAAATNYEGEITMYLSSKNHGDHRIFNANDESVFNEAKRIPTNIPCITADSLNIQPDLVKMDVQGSELAVFEGMNKILSQQVMLFCEFWPYGLRKFSGENGPAEMLSLLQDYGFTIYEIDEKKNQLKTIDQEELLSRFPRFGFVNLLCRKQ